MKAKALDRAVPGLVVLASAVVVVATAGGHPLSGPHGAPRDPERAATALPSPLPSGAAISSRGDLGADDESGCSFADRGFGAYGGWRSLPLGRVLVPSAGITSEDGSFPLLVHFHGAEPVRKQIAPEGMSVVLFALDAGTGSSAYEKPFAFDEAFPSVLHAIEHEVAVATGRENAHARVALSSWSAGSGAVAQIVARHAELVSAVILLDSLYGGYVSAEHVLTHGQLAPFVDLARGSLSGGKPFFLTYSAIPTDGYASTSEVAKFLLGELGREAQPIAAVQGAPLGMRSTFEEGHLVVRGYGGETKDAHCEHLRYLVPALRDVVLPAIMK